MNKKYALVLVIAGIALVIYSVVGKKLAGNNDQNTQVNTVTPTPIMKVTETGLKLYPQEEVTKHTDNTNCWVIVNGKIYDASKYLSENIGDGVLKDNCGKDATRVSAVKQNITKFSYLGDVWVTTGK